MLSNSLFRIQELDRRTLSWWRSRRERIDMDPPYQRRGRRWSKSDKQYLIDSILNGFDIPKLYFADFTWGPSTLNANNSAYAVIDGKQRLEAIFDFFDNKLQLAADFTYIADPTIDIKNLTLEEIRYKHPSIAEDFENFNPIVMGVVTSDKRFIEELFVRLNRSRSLTGAEVRNAMPGPLPELFRQTSKHSFFENNTKFPDNSGQKLNLAAKLFLFEANGDFENTKKANLDSFTKDSSEGNVTEYSQLATGVCKVLDEMSEIFTYKDPLLSSEGPIPVYYWIIKNNNSDAKWLFRDFLEDFSNWLLLNKIKGLSSEELEIELNEYDAALRSVNDKSSHQRRFQILDKWFSNWLNGWRPE